MVNFPSINPVGSSAVPVKKTASRKVYQSTAAEKREMLAVDRRRHNDRRQRRSAKQVMDRRSGMERRRSSIDLSI